MTYEQKPTKRPPQTGPAKPFHCDHDNCTKKFKTREALEQHMKDAHVCSFTAHVVQFLRPDGDRRHVETDLPIEFQSLYRGMMLAGFHFEIEQLQTEEVSCTISDYEQDIDMSVTPNDASVQAGMIEMLKRELWLPGNRNDDAED